VHKTTSSVPQISVAHDIIAIEDAARLVVAQFHRDAFGNARRAPCCGSRTHGGPDREKVTRLAEALAHRNTRSEAAEAIRGLVDAIVLTPAEGAQEAFGLHRAERQLRSPRATAASASS
jgi:hypothetical protein